MHRHADRYRWSVLTVSAWLVLFAAAGSGALAQGASPEATVEATGEAPVQAHVYYFWGDGCPVCEQQRAYFEWLQARYPEVVVHAFEVWFEVPNRELLLAFSDAFGQAVTAVPVTFIGDRGWVGFGQVSSLQMTEVVEAVLQAGSPDAADRLEPELLQRFFDVAD